jgi:hypothetical protein
LKKKVKICRSREAGYVAKLTRFIEIKADSLNWICHILHRNSMLKHVTEGKMVGRIQVTWRQGRISQWLLDDFKEMTIYFKLNAEELYLSHSVRTSFWKRLWTCHKQTTGWMNEWLNEWTLTVPNVTLADISRNKNRHV